MFKSVAFPKRVGKTHTFIDFLKRNHVSMKGKATREGTKRWVTENNVPLSVKFPRSGFHINTMIHGPPTAFRQDFSIQDENAKRAIFRNKSNCLVVYNKYEDESVFHTKSLASILLDKSDVISRDQIVTIANLGPINNPNMISLLQEARYLSGFEHIDYLMVELKINVDTLENHLDDCYDNLAHLQLTSFRGEIQGFGIFFNLPPFNCHKPPKLLGSKYVEFVKHAELEISQENTHLELIGYDFSPSISSLPHYYFPPEFNRLHCFGDNLERHFLRMAWNPFTCYRGVGESILIENEEDMARIIEEDGNLEWTKQQYDFVKHDHNKLNKLTLVDKRNMKVIEDSIKNTFDEVCPSLKFSSHLQDKTMSLIYSQGIDVAVVDSDLHVAVGPSNVNIDNISFEEDASRLFYSFCVPDQDAMSKMEEADEVELEVEDNEDYANEPSIPKNNRKI